MLRARTLLNWTSTFELDSSRPTSAAIPLNGCYTEANVRILVSAGEASGDMYAARLVRALDKHNGHATYFGCTGPRLKEAGVETLLDSSKLSVVGLAEIVGHLPGIYREY